MPKDKSGKYAKTSDLPDAVKNALPAHGQAIFLAAFNSAVGQGSDEQGAYKIAWAAVSKGGYKKGKDGKWTRPSDWKPKDTIIDDRLLAAASDPVIWAGEMEVVQRAFNLQHALEDGEVLLEHGETDEYQLVIKIARSLEQKAIGWLGLTDSDSEVEGVLFEESGDSTRAFHNRGVDQDLDLWTFDGDGQLLERLELVADSSTVVRPTTPYRWALETPKGALAELTGDVTLKVPVAA